MYSVFIRTRNKKVEEILDAIEWDINDIWAQDHCDIIFQSHEYETALDYFHSIKKWENSSWKLLEKSIILTPSNFLFLILQTNVINS